MRARTGSPSSASTSAAAAWRCPAGDRRVALQAGDGTVVARLRADGSGVARDRIVPERLTVPAVAYDGTSAGVSPDGRTLYLVEYTSPRDPTRYAVRAYDVAAGRLRDGAIVDPREPGEQMRGSPLTRASDAGGPWAAGTALAVAWRRRSARRPHAVA